MDSECLLVHLYLQGTILSSHQCFHTFDANLGTLVLTGTDCYLVCYGDDEMLFIFEDGYVNRIFLRGVFFNIREDIVEDAGHIIGIDAYQNLLLWFLQSERVALFFEKNRVFRN